MKRAFNKIRNEKLIIIGLIILLAEILIAAFIPMIMKLDPYSVDNINPEQGDIYLEQTA